ncbi:MAG: hypothetical protein QNL18_00135, partial [Pseudomonadales bacterium]
TAKQTGTFIRGPDSIKLIKMTQVNTGSKRSGDDLAPRQRKTEDRLKRSAPPIHGRCLQQGLRPCWPRLLRRASMFQQPA